MVESMNAGAGVDYDVLMRANLTKVFGERDAARRLIAIEQLYASDAVLHEPHASARGYVQINDAVSELLSKLPPAFVFTPRSAALGHNGIGVLTWRSGPLDGPAAVTGMDVVHLQDGRIHSLSVFIDPPEKN